MDVSLVNNVLEGTRQYFMGVPRQVQAESSGQPVWSASTTLPEEGAPAQSGAPAPSSRPPSAAAAPPSAPPTMSAEVPPRPPSEPIEPEPHIIHKATVMREAAEKRREMPEEEDEEEPDGALSPPSHIIRKPQRPLPSPAPAPAANCPSPSRPPSAALPPPTPSQEPQTESSTQFRATVHRVPTPTTRPPDQFAPGRPPDPYTSSRPPEPYPRYHYETNDGGRNSHGPPVASPQPSSTARQSPQTYARISSSMPHHATSRLREAATHSPPAQRYIMPPVQPPPHNDRVPPIHHPQTVHPPLPQRHDVRSGAVYSPLQQQRQEPSPYGRTSAHYEMHPAVPSRKYDPQQPYPGYRPAPTTPQSVHSHRNETHHPVQYKQAAIETMSQHYAARPPDRAPIPPQPHHDVARLPPRVDYQANSRNVDTRGAYPYPTPSTSTARYAPSTPVPVMQNAPIQSRSGYRPAAAPKNNYEYPTSTPVQTSPARSTVKPGYPNQQARMTVSVTSLVNQMKQKVPHPATSQTNNPVKQKRESPLDLSVKTVKNSADSSTTQDDIVDSASTENKILSLQPRPSSSTRLNPTNTGYVASHKVDFAPNFNQYRDRSISHSYSAPIPVPVPVQGSNHGHHTPVRYNGAYEGRRPLPESYPVESPNPIYIDQNKYSAPRGRNEHVTRIDLTRPVSDQRRTENRVRDDRNFIIEERKRSAGPIMSNIPEKLVRYETWTSDSRLDRINQSTKEQQELMSRPVYSYSSHKQFEAYQNEHKRPVAPNAYREHYPHVNHRYPSNTYAPETLRREPSEQVHHPHYYDKNHSNSSRHHVIQKIPNHRDVHPQHLEMHNGIPADKNVLSILRNSLETKQSGFVEPVRPARHVPDLIVIDDVDDSVIEITDLTENDTEIAGKNIPKQIHSQNNNISTLGSHIKMPRAVDSIQRDPDYQRLDISDPKSKSPENDVASRIRTKAELKVMPPSQDTTVKSETGQEEAKEHRILPKSQKQHLFNQIREDNLRLESVIKCENPSDAIIPVVKTEPMSIDEIEKDAEIPIKTEKILESLEPESMHAETEVFEDDLDWANACDSFVEQLKTGSHKKKTHRKRIDTIERDNENKTEKIQPKVEIVQSEPTEPINVMKSQIDKDAAVPTVEKTAVETIAKHDSIENIDSAPPITIKQEPVDEDEMQIDEHSLSIMKPKKDKELIRNEKGKLCKKAQKENDKSYKSKPKNKMSTKSECTSAPALPIKKEFKEKEPIKTVIKEETESTDDDEPLIKSKLLKEKELKLKEKEQKCKEKEHKNKEKEQKNKEKDQKNKEKEPKSKEKETRSKEKEIMLKEKDQKQKEKELNYKLLKDLSEKSAYVKLECCDVDVNKNNRKSIESTTKDKEEKPSKGKLGKQSSRLKGKSMSSEKNDKQNVDSSSDSDDDLSVATRLRVRKSVKSEDSKEKSVAKTPVKASPAKKLDTSSSSNNSNSVRKPGFGDGSDFHPGWEEELYRYKRSLRMPTRLIAIPRGRSGGPFGRGPSAILSRGTTSLPDLDPAPLSPAPSSAQSVATDDLYSRRPDKITMDSDLDSNSSCSVPNRLQYDSEASTSTVFSIAKKKSNSIVDVLIQKCGRREESKKKSKDKEKEDRCPKVMPKSSNVSELLPTPSLGLVKNGNKGTLSTKKEKLMEDIYYLGAFRKETVAAFRNAFIKNTDGLIGATEEFAPVVLKSRTRTESRVLKQRATIKEVFGDERPASAPPSSCRENDPEEAEEPIIEIKKEPEESVPKPKFKSRKVMKDKLMRRSNSIRDGLRSTKSLKRNDAKGRLLRLKKRNSLIKTLPSKRMKEITLNKPKKENTTATDDKEKEDVPPESPEANTKRRLKRLFGRRKFSSGFDYIRKKKKIIRREDNNANINKIRRPAPKPTPESEHDIHKEIKSWFINKSIGETHLHRAARLGYTDCVAYCLEKMEADPSAKDNAGFTPLHVAAARGHVRIARLLLQYGANVSAAAQGGIRPLHEACENCHVEVIRLLLAYGADPLLVTYAGQTPEELAEGPSALLVKLHIADVQGQAIEPWRFPHPAEIIDYSEMGCDSLSSPPPASPPPPPDATVELQCTEAPLPPFYSLRAGPGQPADGLWCLLQDVTNLLQIKSKDSLLKQIHCGSGSPKELLREIRTQEFLERAQCHQLLSAGEKVNVRASKVALVRVTDKLRQLLKIETELVS